MMTLADLIDNDVLDHGIGRENTTDGFSIGKKGRARFYMWEPTANGYYKIYEQDTQTFEILSYRYVDANETIVKVHYKK